MVTTPTSESSLSDTQLVQEVWSERWQALYEMLDQFVGSVSPGQVASRYAGLIVPRWDTLQPLIERLRAFAMPHYKYFLSGFAPGGNLVADTGVPPDSVYSAVLNQTANDLDVIQSIILQRLSGLSLETTLLPEADQLAMFSLMPAIGTGLLEQGTTVLTYFQKTPLIHVVPYAPIALIGIPFTAIRTFSDLLGTAHEAGHYVFWHGQIETVGKPRSEWPFLYQVLRNEVDGANLPNWCSVWLEELFADIYGCLVFGPVIAVSSQELERYRTERDFRHSDSDHPVPRLRPTIYQKVLYQSTIPERRAWVEKLDRRWRDLVNNKGLRSTSTFVVSGDNNADTNVQVSHATDENNFALDPSKPIDKLVGLILARLPGIEQHWPQRLPYPDLPPVQPDNDNVTLRSLYQWFDSVRTIVLNQVAVPDTLPPTDLNRLRDNWFTEHGFDDWAPPLTRKMPAYPQAGWGFILEAGGWTTEPQEKPWP